MSAEQREVSVRVPEEDDSDDESDSSENGLDKTKTPIKPIIVILLVEMCERVTYYTIAGTQKVYMQNQMHRPASQAASLNSVFSMLCYLWCLPGGLLADGIGRYKTIIVAGLFYCFGTALVGISSIREFQQSWSAMFMLGSLVFIPLGTGGIKPNIANFGADQIGDETPEQRECQKSYFSWFYLMINVGVFIAFGYLANTTTQGAPYFGVDDTEGYFFAYGIGAVFMLIAIGLFVAFTKFYTQIPGSGIGPFITLVKHMCYATTHGGGWRAWFTVIGFLLLPVFFIVTMTAALMPQDEGAGGGAPPDPCLIDEGPPGIPGVVPPARRMVSLRSSFVGSSPPTLGSSGGGGGAGFMNNLALLIGTVSVLLLVIGNLNTKYIQELPGKGSNKEADAEDAEEDDEFGAEECRQALAIVPLLITVNIGFNLAYNAMNNAFPASACQMNTVPEGFMANLLGKKQLNGAFYNIADAIAIIVFTPLFDLLVYPAIEKCKGSPVRSGQKIIAGLLIGAMSNAVAAYLEIQRRTKPYICPATHENAMFSKCAPGYGDHGAEGTRMKDMSAFWIFVPFTLIGIAEILVNPCMYCIAYEAAPEKVRSLVQAFQLFCMGCLSSAFTAAVMACTLPDNLDEGNLEYYYFINIIFAFISIMLYFVLTRCFRHGGDMKKVVTMELDVMETVTEM